ncbi:TPA: hypothetical protein JG872_000357 [Enterobacter hormaechei subsp. xiangfangensis]|nr:hypothetical protein [Enterobacter hormaechei subsp. xiangfangensis]HAV1860663.1 hypothetical protein [Enterobacter hormaechei subsp. xiangfangensis]
MNTRKTLIALTVAGLLMSGEVLAYDVTGLVNPSNVSLARLNGHSSDELHALRDWLTFKGFDWSASTPTERQDYLNQFQAEVNKADSSANINSDASKWASITTAITTTTQGGNSSGPGNNLGLRVANVSAGVTQEQVDTAQNNALVTHAASINANTANIAINKADIDNAYIGINNNKLQAEANKGNIAANAGQIHTLGGTVADHEQKITANKTAADGLRLDVDQNKTDITDTKTGVAGNTALIRQGQEEGFTFAGAVADKLAGIDATIEHLKDRFAALPATTQAAPVNGSLVTTATGTNTTTPNATTTTNRAPFTATTPASQTSVNTPWLKSAAPSMTKAQALTAPQPTTATQSQIDAGQDKAINDVTTVATTAKTAADNAAKGVVRNSNLITTVKAEADKNQTNIAANTSKLTAVQTEADQNKADVATVVKTAADNSKKIFSNRTDIDTNTKGISQNKTDIAAVKTAEQKDRQDIDQNKADVQTNKQNIQANAKNTAKAQADATNAYSVASDAKSDAYNAKFEADANQADIAALKPQVDANTQQLSTLQAYAGNAQQAIDKGDAETLAKSKDYTDSKFKQLKKQVQQAEKKANAGSASALAAVGIPGLSEGQTWNVGAGVGQYSDASAVAVGANYRVSEHVALKLGVTATPTTQDYGAFAGVSIGN